MNEEWHLGRAVNLGFLTIFIRDDSIPFQIFEVKKNVFIKI